MIYNSIQNQKTKGSHVLCLLSLKIKLPNDNFYEVLIFNFIMSSTINYKTAHNKIRN